VRSVTSPSIRILKGSGHEQGTESLALPCASSESAESLSKPIHTETAKLTTLSEPSSVKGDSLVSYILQRINHRIFKQPDILMHNIERVTSHVNALTANVAAL
jgi:hypothetical protein